MATWSHWSLEGEGMKWEANGGGKQCIWLCIGLGCCYATCQKRHSPDPTRLSLLSLPTPPKNFTREPLLPYHIPYSPDSRALGHFTPSTTFSRPNFHYSLPLCCVVSMALVLVVLLSSMGHSRSQIQAGILFSLPCFHERERESRESTLYDKRG